MTDNASIIEQLRRLTADELRARLAALDAEERALRVLLRAAIAAERARPNPPMPRAEGRANG